MLKKGYLKVKFFVGLRHEACKDYMLLSTMKEDMKNVGIIRVCENGSIRFYVYNREENVPTEVLILELITGPLFSISDGHDNVQR